jgi:hypothetical protein
VRSDIHEKTYVIDVSTIDYSCYYLFQVINDGAKSTKPVIDISKFEIETSSIDHIVDASSFLVETTLAAKDSATDLNAAKYVESNNTLELIVNSRDTSLVNIHRAPSVDSEILGTIQQGNKVLITGEIGDWVSIDFQEDPSSDSETAWILRRFEDQIYLISSNYDVK